MLWTRRPGLCAVCHGWGDGRVCAPCLERFATPVPRCGRCALRVPPGQNVCGACLVSPPAFDAALAAVDYAFPWDRLVARFKFHGALELTPVFAQGIVRAHRASKRANPAWVLPVPLVTARLRERGYNQAWELARRVARACRVPADAHLLLRTRDTPHQLALPPDARAGNVSGAFAVEPARRGELKDRAVMVVDDVMTTGSTAAEIARTLAAAGASSVTIAVFARTPRPGDA